MFGRTRERVMNGSLGPAVLAKPTILRPREHLTLTRRAGIEKRRVYEEVLVEDAYTRKQVTPSTRVYPPAPNHAPEQHLSANRTFRQLSHFFFSCCWIAFSNDVQHIECSASSVCLQPFCGAPWRSLLVHKPRFPKNTVLS